MTTLSIEQNKGFSALVESMKAEITQLRSIVIGLIGNDKEGEYKQKFVDEIFSAAKENSQYEFTDKKTFLSQLKKA